MTTLHDRERRGFASDNQAGAHPDVITALVAANGGHQPSYGEDAHTERLAAVVRRHFGPGALVFPVLNGTGANVVALQAVLPRWGSVVCAESAHIHTDENAAPERVGGIKLLTTAAPGGKLTPELIERRAWGLGDQHHPQPLAVSITESTELGTCYSVAELRAVTEAAHGLGMWVHLDGARLANAAAALDVPLAALTTDAGVDIVSLGGTKAGLAFGEAVVVCNPAAAQGIPHLRKSSLQLAAKMRFISAQLVALYEADLWRSLATHANAMAARLRAGVDALDGVTATRPTDANAVFAVLDPGVAAAVRRQWSFHDWDAATGEVRWMCSWDTTTADVDAFLACLGRELSAHP